MQIRTSHTRGLQFVKKAHSRNSKLRLVSCRLFSTSKQTNTGKIEWHTDLPPSLAKMARRFRMGTTEYFLLGTVHNKPESRLMIEKMVESFKPDCCVLELPPKRFATQGDKEAITDRSIWNTIVEHSRSVVWSLSEAEELVYAEELLSKQGVEVIRADRDPVITNRRLLSVGGIKFGFNIVTNVLAQKLGISLRDRIMEATTHIDFEEMIDAANEDPYLMMEQSVPTYDIVVAERDLLFTKALMDAPGKRVMGIFGAVHLHGVSYFMEHVSRDEPLFKALHTTSEGLYESSLIWGPHFKEWNDKRKDKVETD